MDRSTAIDRRPKDSAKLPFLSIFQARSPEAGILFAMNRLQHQKNGSLKGEKSTHAEKYPQNYAGFVSSG